MSTGFVIAYGIVVSVARNCSINMEQTRSPGGARDACLGSCQGVFSGLNRRHPQSHSLEDATVVQLSLRNNNAIL